MNHRYTVKNIIVAILAIVCIVLLLVFWKGKDPDVLNAEQEKMTAPITQAATENLAWNCQLRDGNGQTVEFRDLYNKKPVYLLFWAPWSRESLTQLETISSMYKTYGKDVYFVIVNFDSDSDAAFDVVNQKGYAFPIYMVSVDVTNDYHVYNVPSSFFIRKGGQIMNRDEDVLSEKELQYKFARVQK